MVSQSATASLRLLRMRVSLCTGDFPVFSTTHIIHTHLQSKFFPVDDSSVTSVTAMRQSVRVLHNQYAPAINTGLRTSSSARSEGMVSYTTTRHPTKPQLHVILQIYTTEYTKRRAPTPGLVCSVVVRLVLLRCWAAQVVTVQTSRCTHRRRVALLSVVRVVAVASYTYCFLFVVFRSSCFVFLFSDASTRSLAAAT